MLLTDKPTKPNCYLEQHIYRVEGLGLLRRWLLGGVMNGLRLLVGRMQDGLNAKKNIIPTNGRLLPLKSYRN